MKKDYSALYGEALLLSVNDFLKTTESPVTISDLVDNLFGQIKGYDKQKAKIRVRRCVKTLVETNRATQQETKTRYKTTLHLYQWKQ